MERVVDQQPTQEIFENDIELYLDEFCNERKIEDMTKQSQSIWNAALMYINKHAFTKQTFKEQKPLEGYHSNDYQGKFSNLNKSTCNRYNVEMLDELCDYYIYLCMSYSKEVSITGFSYLTGVSTTIISQWGDEVRKLSTSASSIYKKLVNANEESLSNMLISSGKSPVGPIAALNHRHGWASPYVSDSGSKAKALSTEEVRALLTAKNGDDIVQFAQGKNEV